MPGSIESTSPDHGTVSVPPRFAVVRSGDEVVSVEPQPASRSTAATGKSVRFIIPPIGGMTLGLTVCQLRTSGRACSKASLADVPMSG
jgi:hypothetical protein